MICFELVKFLATKAAVQADNSATKQTRESTFAYPNLI